MIFFQEQIQIKMKEIFFLIQFNYLVHKLAVWVGTEESHSDFRHHLQTQSIMVYEMDSN